MWYLNILWKETKSESEKQDEKEKQERVNKENFYIFYSMTHLKK